MLVAAAESSLNAPRVDRCGADGGSGEREPGTSPVWVIRRPSRTRDPVSPRGL